MKSLINFFTEPSDLLFFMSSGAEFHTLAASLKKVWDWMCEYPVITRSGLFESLSPGLFITSAASMVAEAPRICGRVGLHGGMTSYLGRAWWDFGAAWLLLDKKERKTCFYAKKLFWPANGVWSTRSLVKIHNTVCKLVLLLF